VAIRQRDPESEAPLHWVSTGNGLRGALERAVNSAVSRGPGYEPTPLASSFDAESVRGYYIDYSAKTTTPEAGGDLDRLTSIPVIQLALGWWERHQAGDPKALHEFLRVCGHVERRAERREGALWWSMPVAISKHELLPGWRSALSQGQGASVFVRAHLATQDDHFAELASAALEPLVSEDANEIVTHTGDGPILEESPSRPASHVLNGWISALWGVRDVAIGLRDDRAERVFDRSLACLRTNLHAYDTGWWSRYSLFPHPLEDLAKPIYHRFHVAQLRALHRLTGDALFRDTAERWAGYDRTPNRVIALLQKTAFVAADAPRRRRWGARYGSGSSASNA
jgi:heparosan-N-sulfate-glucuronate 5-epimerase